MTTPPDWEIRRGPFYRLRNALRITFEYDALYM